MEGIFSILKDISDSEKEIKECEMEIEKITKRLDIAKYQNYMWTRMLIEKLEVLKETNDASKI